MQFSDLNLIEPILKALTHEGYTTPTPIQEQSIPLVLAGKDVMGCAQTGTGKTASFAIPILQLLYNTPENPQTKGKIKALILTPTRELAIQIGESFASYGKHTGISHTVIYGGVGQSPQVKAIRKGADVVIATPGRLMDLMQQKHINLGNISMFVLDEADRMLDMGFIHDIKRILKTLPHKRQSLFFSATMPPVIMELAHTILKDPVKVVVSPISSTVQTVKQSLYFVDKPNKKDLLIHILKDTSIERALVFTRTKHGADKVTKQLITAGITAAAIHGDKSQGARQAALTNLKMNRIRVLVATDIAARGIDINELSHVFIYDIPTEPETYVHRIGRTGRAGAQGVAIAFCDGDEKKYLKEIVAVIKRDIDVVEDHPYPSAMKPGNIARFGEVSSGRARPARPARVAGAPRTPRPRPEKTGTSNEIGIPRPSRLPGGESTAPRSREFGPRRPDLRPQGGYAGAGRRTSDRVPARSSEPRSANAFKKANTYGTEERRGGTSDFPPRKPRVASSRGGKSSGKERPAFGEYPPRKPGRRLGRK